MNAESLPLTITEQDLSDPVPSPFLPGTNIQYAWDSTSLGYMKQCPRLYQYVMIEGWMPKEDNVHLRFGGEFHTALEQYDILKASGCKHGEALRAVVGDLVVRVQDWDVDTDSKAGRYKNIDTLLSLVIDYLDKYKDETAETLILENGSPAVELSFRFELDWGPGHRRHAWYIREDRENWDCSNCGATMHESERDPDNLGECPVQPYLLCGHLDRVVTFQEELFVMDRKTTTTSLGSYFFDRFEPDNQMTLYTLASQVILGATVKGVIVDGCQILLDKPNQFTRGMTYRTPDQLTEWVESLKFILSEAENYAKFNYWPMRDTSCGMYGGCKFRDICSKSPGVRERFLESAFIKREESERWNPLKPR